MPLFSKTFHLIDYRFSVGSFGKTTSELIWLKNPGDLTPTNENGEWLGWEYGILIEGGPDVYFEIITLYDSENVAYDVLVTGKTIETPSWVIFFTSYFALLDLIKSYILHYS